MKVRRLSMSTKIFLFISILLLVSDAFIGIFFFNRAKGMLIEQMLINTLNMSKTAATTVDGAALESIEFGDESSTNYQKVFDNLCIVRDNCGAEYVYIVKEDDGTMYYSVDTALDSPAANGDEFAEIDSYMQSALNGTAALDPNPYTDSWGTHYTAYSPIYNGDTVVGVMCVDSSYSWVKEQSRNTLFMVISICGVSFIAGIVILLIIRRKLYKGFTLLNGKIEELAGGGGDLTKKIEIHTGDEFEVIGENVNNLVSYIREVLISIVNGTKSLEDATGAIFGRLDEASADTTNVGTTLTELSAAMQNTMDAMEEIDNLVGGINDVFGGIVTEVKDGSDYAHDIRKQAQNTGDTAMKAQEDAKERVRVMQDAINERLTRSEAVSQINALTENILSITSQTNLLALNASIEAARAGEAGKGFAVVATEIGTLATDSASAAGEIQRVSAEVIQAVRDLADEAKRMMEFIDENVLQSYDQLVETSNQFRASAEHVDDIMSKFSEMSTNVQRDIDQIKRNTGMVSDSVRESNNALAQAADRASDVSGNITGINSEAEKATHISDELGDAVSKFKVN